MPRLVINPGSPTASEVQLRPGINSLGRAATNDFQIQHPSVSGSHCQIVVSEDSVLLRDLGSTNGTLINQTRILEAALTNAQAIRLGEVDMIFYADLPGGAALLPSYGPEMTPAPASGHAVLPRATETLAYLSPASTTTRRAVGAESCRFHPKMPARLLCERCQHFFCEACVALRIANGVPHKFCRHCGAECVPVLAEFAPVTEQGFWERVPGAFLYPLRGAGVIIVIIGIVLVALLKLGEAAIEYRTVRMMIFGVIMEIFVGGYLFTFLQAMIHSTEAGERELPDLPGIANFLDDVLVPFGRLLTLSLVCFGPVAGVVIWKAVTHDTGLAPVLIGAAALGYLYFPMAFLAVATLDSLAAANPLLIVPSILRAPAEYGLALALLASVFGTQYFGGLLIQFLFPEGWIIHSMGGLLAMVAMMLFLSFLSLYLLIVAVHTLGLIFVSRRERLAWLDRRGGDGGAVIL